jgi:hypothetical protein
LYQKYEAFKAISEKIDNLMILSKNNVINIENIEKFCDMLIDIQNNIAKELNYIKPCAFALKNDPGQNGFYKKFSDISKKLTKNLGSSKMSAIPDYLDIMANMIKKTENIGNIIIIFN